ncbi:MAG TPA: sigma-70 family RNA polymerase sigma factor, partial [Rhodothermales bacterium]|nr:sigma-70 family RNA polymerase sigma factor [Rhodothermales bacterium]
NLARASLRKQKRLRPVDDEEMERLQPAFQNGHYAQAYDPWNPEQVAEREDRKRIVNKAIESLPEQYRTVLVLRDMEGWSTEETARAVGTSEGAVRVRLHRARQALRTLLDPYFRG